MIILSAKKLLQADLATLYYADMSIIYNSYIFVYITYSYPIKTVTSIIIIALVYHYGTFSCFPGTKAEERKPERSSR